jgi:alanyl-tRNA synthetase
MDDLIKEAAAELKTSPDDLVKRIRASNERLKELTRGMEGLRAKLSAGAIDGILQNITVINGVNVAAAAVDGEADANVLRELSDRIKEKLSPVVAVLSGGKDGRYVLLSSADDAAVKLGINCGAIIKEAAVAAGGNGGGKPGMAQAGVKDAAKLGDAIAAAGRAIEAQLCMK